MITQLNKTCLGDEPRQVSVAWNKEDQNERRAPICMRLLKSTMPQIWPASPISTNAAPAQVGCPKFSRLTALNASHFKSRWVLSVMTKDLVIDKSTKPRPGPIILLRPAFPKVYCAGSM